MKHAKGLAWGLLGDGRQWAQAHLVGSRKGSSVHHGPFFTDAGATACTIRRYRWRRG